MSHVEKFMTIKEVAERLAVGENTVRSICYSRKLQHIKVGNRIRISEAQLQDYIQRVTSPPPAPSAAELRRRQQGVRAEPNWDALLPKTKRKSSGNQPT